MFIAVVTLLVLYVAPLAFIVNRIRRDLHKKSIDRETAVTLFSVSLIPFVSLIGIVVIAYSAYNIPSPTDLWSRFVLYLLGSKES